MLLNESVKPQMQELMEEERRILPRKPKWTDNPEPERTWIAPWMSLWANNITNDGLCAPYTSLISWYHIHPREMSGGISELTRGFFYNVSKQK